jgi:hypothetical protein
MYRPIKALSIFDKVFFFNTNTKPVLKTYKSKTLHIVKLEADKSKFKEPPVICGQSRIQMVRKTSYQDF